MNYTLTDLDGIRLIVEHVPQGRSAAIGCSMDVGSLHETGFPAGIAHFIEHLVFKGTQELPSPKQVTQAVEGVGGVLEAETSFTTTLYWSKVPLNAFERALETLAEIICRPLLRTEDIERERSVIQEELRGLYDSPSDLVHALAAQNMWGEQPFGRDVAGTLESVAATTHEDALRYHAEHYTRQNLIISIAGGVTNAQAVETVTRAFAGLRSQPGPSRAIPTLPPQPGPKVTLVRRETEQTHLCLSFPACDYHDPDFRTFQLFDTLLSGMSGRLFIELREERGLAYDIGSYLNEIGDAGQWTVFAGVEPSKLIESTKVLIDILQDVAVKGFPDEDIAIAKQMVRGRTLIAMEDTWTIASRNCSLLQRYGHITPIEETLARIEALTADDLRRVARRLLQRNGLQITVIGPHRARDEARLRALAKAFDVPALQAAA